jgi:hypothetical protein
MKCSAAWLTATLSILPLAAIMAAPPRLPPVIVHIEDAPGNQCLITADGQPFAINTPPPAPLKQQMLARGVRLTYADPKPDFHCISGVIFPLQAEGIDIRN